MNTLIKDALLLITALTALMVASPARGENKHNEDIKFQDVSLLGTGCPEGTTSTIASPDGTALTILFDEFMAEVPQYDGENDNDEDEDQPASRFDQKRSHKICKINLTAKIPEGHKVDSVDVSVDFRGATSVEQGSTAMFRSMLMNWNGMGRTRMDHNQGNGRGRGRGGVGRAAKGQLIAHKMWMRPIDEDWTISKTLNIPTRTGCSAHGDKELKLSMRNIVAASMGRRIDPESTSALIMMDSADLAGKLKIKINSSPCGGHQNGGGHGNGHGNGNGNGHGNGYGNGNGHGNGNGYGRTPKCQRGWEYNPRLRRCVRKLPSWSNGRYSRTSRWNR